jgi:hypothetical protein
MAYEVSVVIPGGVGPWYYGAMSHPADVIHAVDEGSTETVSEALEPHVWEGDDDHVIFWMLSLTPTQRLAALQGFVDSFMMLRNGRTA